MLCWKNTLHWNLIYEMSFGNVTHTFPFPVICIKSLMLCFLQIQFKIQMKFIIILYFLGNIVLSPSHSLGSFSPSWVMKKFLFIEKIYFSNFKDQELKTTDFVLLCWILNKIHTLLNYYFHNYCAIQGKIMPLQQKCGWYKYMHTKILLRNCFGW